MDQTIDLLDVAAKRFPIKALCSEIGKAESSLRNELTQQEHYKLGLQTAIQIMKITGDLSALDRIEGFFNRVAYPLPDPEIQDVEAMVNLVAKLSKEYGEQMTAIGIALHDGTVTYEEAQTCLKETEDLIQPILQLRAVFQQMRNRHKGKTS